MSKKERGRKNKGEGRYSHFTYRKRGGRGNLVIGNEGEKGRLL